MALVIREADLQQGLPVSGGDTARLPTVDDVRAQAKAKGIDPEFAVSIFTQESGANPNVQPSQKGARGGMQVMPGTFKQVMGDDGNIDDPWDNLEAGLRYIAYGQKKVGTDAKLLAAGYHQGYDHPDLQRGVIANTSDGRVRTPDYARQVVARMGVKTKAGTVVAPTPIGGEPRDAEPVSTDPQDRLMTDLAREGLRIRGTTPVQGAAAEKEVPALDNLADLGKGLKIGFNVAAQDIRELTRRIPVVGPTVVAALDRVDQYFTGTTSEALLKADDAAMTAGMSDKMQAALQKKWYDDAGDEGVTGLALRKFGDAWLDWRSYAGGLMQSLPEQTLTMFPALRLAKGVYASRLAAGEAAGLSATAAAEKAGLAAARSAAVAGGVLEGTLAGAQSSRQVRDDIAKMSEADLKDSDAVKALMGQGMSFADARQQLADDAATKAFFLSGISTGIFGGMGDRVLAKAMLGQLKGGFAARVAKGAVSEGLIEELPQSGLQQVSQNVAMRDADPSVSLNKDVLNQAFGGLAIGAVQGGIQTGVFGRSGVDRETRGARGSDQAARGIRLDSDTGAVPARDVFGGAAEPERGRQAPAKAPGDAETNLMTPVSLSALDRVEAIDARLGELGGDLAAVGAGTPEAAPLEAERAALVEERAGLAKDFPKVVAGAETVFQTESGAELRSQYGLVEASALVTSHDENLRPNPAYPKALQPRERERAASEVQVSAITQKLNPARLGASADAATGAPIIGGDGVVESGNARSIALKRVYQAGGQKAQDYRAYLEQNADRFGLTAAQIAAMQQPVLVRVRKTAVNRAEFARQANAPTTATMSPAETARSDAARLDNLDDLVLGERGEIPRAKNAGFIKRFLSGLSQTEQNGLVDADGELSQAGVTRIRNAVLGRAYGDSPALMRMVESLDNNLRNVTAALVRVAPQVAKARDSIRDGALHDADITADLVAAVEELSKIRERGQTVAQVLAQSEMFGLTLSPEAVDLLQFLDANMRHPNKIAAFVQNYLDALGAAGSPAQGSLIGSDAAPARRDIIKAAKGRLNEDDSGAVPAGTAGQPEAAAASAPGAGEASQAARAGTTQDDDQGGDRQPDQEGDAGGTVQSRVAAALDEYEDTGAIESVEDLVNRVEAIAEDDDNQDLRRLVEAYRAEHDENMREWGGRGDQDAYEEALVQGLRAFAQEKAGADAFREDDGSWTFVGPNNEKGIGYYSKAEALKAYEDTYGEAARPARIEQAEVKNDHAKAMEEFNAALGELGEFIEQMPGATLKMLPDAERKKLIPVLTKLFSAAVKLGYVKFKDASAYVLKAINANEKLRALTEWLTQDDYREAFDAARAAASDAVGTIARPFKGGDKVRFRDGPNKQVYEVWFVNAEGTKLKINEPAPKVWRNVGDFEKVADAAAEAPKEFDVEAGRTSPEAQKMSDFQKGIEAARAKDEAADYGENTLPYYEPALTGEARKIEERFRAWIWRHREEAMFMYRERLGNYLSTDEARELGRDYAKSSDARSLYSASVHEPASWLIKQLYARMLAEPVPAGKLPRVLITAGGTGAGKTRGVRELAEAREIADQANIVYDTNLQSKESGTSKIDAALAAGRDVAVFYVHRDPVVALTHGALPRAMKRGRAVPLVDHAGTHAGASKAIHEIANEYKDNDKVGVMAIDNSRGVGGAVWMRLEDVKPLAYNEIHGRLVEALEREREKGGISDVVYRGTRGPDAAQGLDEKDGRGDAQEPSQSRAPERVASGEQPAQRTDVRAPGGEPGDAGKARKARSAKPVDSGSLGFDFTGGGEGARESGTPAAAPARAERPGGADVERRQGGGEEQRDAGQRPAGTGRDKPGPVAGPSDYTITDADALGAGGAKTKARGNIAAIRLLNTLKAEDRGATADEKAVLVKYVGWGGIKQLFDEGNADFAKEREELKALISADDYAAARRSVLDSHYTSKPVVQAIYAALMRMGFNGGAVLEPAAGIGHFIGLMPGDIRAYSRFTAVELDPTTGGIAQKLYEKSDVNAGVGFEAFKVREGWYDAAVGNPPFGETKLFDEAHRDISKFSLHNFFFAKSLLALRPGGVLGMVVSNFMLDANKSAAREWMAQRADLLGAIRLPNTAFAANAGTEVTTDIVFLRRREKDLSAEDAKDVPWVKVGQIRDEKTGKPITLNAYFVKNAKMMLGKMTLGGTMYGAESAALEPVEGQDLAKALTEAIANLPRNAYLPGTRSIEDLTNVDGMVPDGVKVGGYFVLPDGQIGMRQSDVEGKTRSTLAPLREKTRDRVKGMIELRDAMNKLMRAELSGAGEQQARNLRAALHRAYDGFVKKFGYVNDTANRRAFDKDPDAPRVEALEKDYDPGLSKGVAAKEGVEPRKPSAKKADIFSKATQAPRTEITRVENAADALSASLGEKGRIDFDYMEAISGKSREQLKADLAGVIYKNPNAAWEPADKYLSGNVKAKLAEARRAAAEDPAYRQNVEALEKVRPADIEPLDISVRLGSPWIPAADVSAFIESILKEKPKAISYQGALAKWFLEMPRTLTNEIRTVWGAITEDDHGGKHGWDAVDIIQSVLNQTPIIVKENHGTKEEPHWVTLEAETRLAQQKAEDIRLAFKSWLWEDQERRERLARKYNDTFNTNVLRVFDGSHLTLPGTNPSIALTPNKKHSVWRMIQDNNVLLDHVVGSGKTFTTAAGFMEMRRLGLMKKGMVVVPNHLVKQWRDEWYALYPNANVLAATEQDFDRENRQRLFSRIATGDWDAVIVPHTSFGKIGMPPALQKEILEEQINDLTAAIEKLKKEEKGRDPSVRQMEKIRERMKERIARLAVTGAKDQAINFDELAIDGLAVDEAHLFKNLFYYSQMRGVAGLGDPTGSQRAFDLFVKVRYLNKIGGRVIYATGTPVSNSLVEMFTMQRYMSYDELRAKGIHHLDSWAGVYGNITQVWEIDPSGQGSRLSTRFAKFVNLPELITSYRTFADVLTMTDLQEQFKRDTGKPYPVPKMKSGKPQNLVAKRSPEQERYFGVAEDVLDSDGKPVLDDKGRPLKQWNEGSILYRIENMPKDPREDNMLKVTNDARFAGLDLRTIFPDAPDFKGSKVNDAVKQIVRLYKKWDEDLGTQLVFLDLSKPSGKKAVKTAPVAAAVAATEEGATEEEKHTVSMDELLADKVKFSVYDDMKAKLVKAGIPEREIAFIHDANTAEQKRSLFGKVNRGEVRILMGSTPKMGAGTNAQRRLVGLHHIDAPWRPSDLEQREGRIIRRGNMLYERDPDGFEVEVNRYGTEQSYDTRMWQLLEHKARGIEQLRRGEITARETEDVDGEAANAADMKAAVSGNPLIMEEIKSRVEVQKLEGLEQAAKRQKFAMQSQAARLAAAPQRRQAVEDVVQPFIAARKSKLKDSFAFTTRDGDTVSSEDNLAGPVLGALKTAIESEAVVYAGQYRGIDLWFNEGGVGDGKYVDVIGGLGRRAPAQGWGKTAEWMADKIVLTSYRKGQEFKPSGFITRLDNAYEQFETKISEAKTLEARDLKELAKVKAELDKPWERAAELERARAEHRRILALIDAGETGTEPPPVQPPPGGQFAASRLFWQTAMKDSGVKQTYGVGEAEVDTVLERALNTVKGWFFQDFVPSTALMSSVKPQAYGVDVEDVQAVVDRVTAGAKNINSGGIKVVKSVEDLPAKAKGFVYSQGASKDIEGLFDKDTRAIYLVADNLASPERAQFVVFHELFGHYGLRGVFGDKLNAELSEIYVRNDNVRREAERLMKKYGYSMSTAVEEVLADMAGRGQAFTGFKRLLAKIVKLLHDMGFGELAAMIEQMTDAEALSMIARAREWVEGGEPHIARREGDGQMFKRADAKGFAEWFEGSKIVRGDEPMTMFRGEWGGRPGANPFRNTSPFATLPTFTNDPAVASVYADSPNYRGLLGMDGGDATRQRVGYYYLAIKKPLALNAAEEDVTEIGHLVKSLTATGKVGEAEVRKFVSRAPVLWRLDGDEVSIESVAADERDRVYTDSYRLADNPGLVDLARRAGFDGFTYYGPTHDSGQHWQAWEARPFGPSQIRAAFRREAPLHSVREIVDERPSNAAAPAPLPGEPFLVYRVGDSPDLTFKNAGNANSVARHLAGFDDFDAPSAARVGDSIMVFRVYTDGFGAYEGLRRGSRPKGEKVGRAVRGTEVAYSFPEKNWTAVLEDRIPLADVRELLTLKGYRGSFDEAGSNKGADAIREAFERGANMKADMRAQIAYMRARVAAMPGQSVWTDLDAFAAQNPDEFNRLAKEWRDRQDARERRQAKPAPKARAAELEMAMSRAERKAPAPRWYSALERGVGRLTMKSASAGHWMATIDAMPGVKRDEIEWSGVKDWLRTREGSVGKDDVMAYLQANGVQLSERILGHPNQRMPSDDRIADDVALLKSKGFHVDQEPNLLLWGVVDPEGGEIYTTAADAQKFKAEIGEDVADAAQRVVEYLNGDAGERLSAAEQEKALAELTLEYQDWNRRQGLNLGSADEHLTDPALTPEQRAWVNEFSRRWDRVTGANSPTDVLTVRLDALGYTVVNDEESEVFGVYRRDAGILFSDGDKGAVDDYIYDTYQISTPHKYLEDLPAEEREMVRRLGDLLEYEQDPYQARDAAGDDGTRYSQYASVDNKPGTYREMLLTLPNRDRDDTELRKLWWAAQDRKDAAETTRLGNEIAALAERRNREEFFGDHFDDPNIVAHIRFGLVDDADGRTGVLMNENQSDFAKAARQHGFKNALPPNLTYQESNGGYRAVMKNDPLHSVGGVWPTKEEVARHLPGAVGRVPPAPFVGKTEAWLALSVRRMIRYAAERGHAFVAWEPGQVHVDRYPGLEQVVERVTWEKRFGGEAGRIVVVYLKNGGGLTLHTDADGVVTESVHKKRLVGRSLGDVVGKDVAVKILASDEGRLQGEGLKIGGTGMRKFYDVMLPAVANDVLKKLGGGRVREIQINGNPRMGFDITPALREKALEGMPMFSRASQQETPAERADARLEQRVRQVRPLEALAKAAVKLTRFDRATAWAYDKLLQTVGNLVPEKVKAGVVADYGIPEAVTDRRVAMQGSMRQHMREIEGVLKALGGLTRAESRVAYEWMNADDPQAADYFRDQLPPESIRVLADIEKMIDSVSAEAVRLGQMSEDVRARNRFAYLRRSYFKHTAELTPQEGAKRSRAISVFGEQYKGRGIVDAVGMKKIENSHPTWWRRKLQAGKADVALRGEKFIRLERRAPAPGAGVMPIAGIGPAQAGQGRLLEVVYWPAAEPVPARLASWERPGGPWEVRGVKGGDLLMWRDFSKQEREAMGEIDEVKYAVARTLHGMVHDVEVGRYLEWLANTQAMPNANRIARDKIVAAKDSLWHSFAPDEWVQVPDTKIAGTDTLRYGKLAGLYLPGPIWNDVRQTVNQNLQPLGEYYAAILRAWKISKTALSPAVHMNNVMANVVMADWHDVGAAHLVKALDILIHQDDAANKIIVNRFEDAGGTVGTFSVSELQREQLAPMIEQLRREMGEASDAGLIGAGSAVQLALSGKFREALAAAASGRVARGVETVAGKMIDLYQSEDVVFRLAAFLRAKENGDTDAAAGKAARSSFLDYHINAPWIQMMRSTAFPFISFTYRAAPMLLEIAAKKPWKLLKLAMIAGGLNALGYALSGGDEDKERKRLPAEKSGRVFGALAPKLLRMPWNDANGSPVFLDIRRWVPVGDIFDLGQSHAAVPILPVAVPGGPLAVLAELVFNKSQFTGREVTKDTDTAAEKAGKVFSHLYKAMAPNVVGLPGTYATKAVVEAATGKTDAFGREQSTTQALLSSVGVKVGAYPRDVMEKNLRSARDRALREIGENVTALRREFANKSIGQAEFDKRMAVQNEKREKVNRDYAAKLN